jgi:hypothetical protein
VKAFPYFRLPREIRDRIYLFPLRTSITAKARALQDVFLAIENYPGKPPTSGLLRANTQIYREAAEVLYSKNIIAFHLPQELFDFEQIGASNRDLIQGIKITVMTPAAHIVVTAPGCLALSDYESCPSHWAVALQKSRLRKNRSHGSRSRLH